MTRFPSQLRSASITFYIMLSALVVIQNALGGARAQKTHSLEAVTSHASRGANTGDANSWERPRLVLLIVVDQFRYDYIDRFGDLFGPGGINRLLRDGASWTNTNYDHVPTETAPGHATLMTGAWPEETGIVANEWYDRALGRDVSSVSDYVAKLLGKRETGQNASSPHRLLSSTLGDELRLASNDRSKVIGVSVKDRAAILPAGRHASAAYWFNLQTGEMVTSNYYLAEIPAWVARFNAARPADTYLGRRWERLLPEAEYLKRAGPDAPAWEQVRPEQGTNTFPHKIEGERHAIPDARYYEALCNTPYSNDVLLEFAEAAISGEHLGQGSDTDVLTISFSSNDYIGHRYGPYSQEVMDAALRTDVQIASLLSFVDARIGLRNSLVVFTADHGVAPIPEHAATLGLNGGRIKNSDVLNAMGSAIRARYGAKGLDGETTDHYIEAFIGGNVYFNLKALAQNGINIDEIERVVGEGALTVAGISRYFTRAQLQSGTVAPADQVARRVLHGFYVSRSGDCILITEPFKYLVGSGGKFGTSHGSPYSYDTHVPMILMGAGLRPGRYSEAATPADIAPTLANILRVQMPSNATGRVLSEALPR